MTEAENEKTTGGLVGKLAGKAKEAAGEITNNDDLAREGRLQQAQSESDLEASARADEARQHDAEAQLEQEKVETRAEAEKLRAEVDAEQEEIAAESEQAREEQRAEAEGGRRGSRGSGRARGSRAGRRPAGEPGRA